MEFEDEIMPSVVDDVLAAFSAGDDIIPSEIRHAIKLHVHEQLLAEPNDDDGRYLEAAIAAEPDSSHPHAFKIPRRGDAEGTPADDDSELPYWPIYVARRSVESAFAVLNADGAIAAALEATMEEDWRSEMYDYIALQMAGGVSTLKETRSFFLDPRLVALGEFPDLSLISNLRQFILSAFAIAARILADQQRSFDRSAKKFWEQLE